MVHWKNEVGENDVARLSLKDYHPCYKQERIRTQATAQSPLGAVPTTLLYTLSLVVHSSLCV